MYHSAPESQSETTTALNKTVKRFWQEEQFVEYGLLLLLVSLAAISHMVALATAIANAFESASQNLTTR
jgi:Flp pilus assembly pilin Flp